MSATVETPVVPGPVQGPTREEPLIEALLLDDYPALVHLAYLILPPSISRARRVAAAHAVVQHALPPGLTLSTSDPRELMRRRVIAEAARQAARQSAPARLGGLLARADALTFEPCSTKVDVVTTRQRCLLGRRVATVFTLVVAVGILVSLLTS